MEVPEFQIEQIVTVTGRGVYVIARHIAGDAAFTVGPNAALGGVRIEPWVDQPRVLQGDGTPDLDVFAFRLKSIGDRGQLTVGQRTHLEGTISRQTKPRRTSNGRPWLVFVIPTVIVFVGALWSFIALTLFQSRTHEPLYALFAYTDSAGTGNIYWKVGGEREAFYRVELPFYVTLSAIVLVLVARSRHVWCAFGRAAFASYWMWGVICALIATAIFGWFWLNVIGLFI